MKDSYAREIDYARISITDQCNLSCKYCKSENDELLPQQMNLKQLKTLIKVLNDLHFRKLRFTGGEPLLCKDIVEILEYAKNQENIKDIGLTTNGIFLDQYLEGLVKAGLKRINISLDTLKKQRYQEITGADYLERVIHNIVMAKNKGLIVKVNAVLMKGVNDDEIADFLKFGRENDVQVRFIELMTIGDNNDYVADKQLNVAERFKDYQRKEKKPNCKDVSDYFYDEHGYCFGIISPISNHFCDRCNRIRFTSDGKLRLCLHSDVDIDIYPYLDDEKKLYEIISKEIKNKPEKHYLDEDKSAKRAMSKIGG